MIVQVQIYGIYHRANILAQLSFRKSLGVP
jgi:hypothetical protein